MFQVGRYDPRAEDRKRQKAERLEADKKRSKKKKHKKRKAGDADLNQHENENKNEQDRKDGGESSERKKTTTLHVIAPETEGAVSARKKLNTKLTEEAFDDLDLVTTEVDDDDDDEEFLSSSKDERIKSKGDGVDDNDNDDDAESDGMDIDNDENIEAEEPEFDPTNEIQRALHMSKLPIEEAAKRWGLADFLVHNLTNPPSKGKDNDDNDNDNGDDDDDDEKENNRATDASFQTFFPIQALVIPDVVIAERHSSQVRARDICVAAPTGSGKTLAFVLPVLNALATRKIRRLRALVVLPSRDLAKQVHDVFVRFAHGSDLKIGLAIGQSDFKSEQKSLMIGSNDDRKAAGDSAADSSLSYLWDIRTSSTKEQLTSFAQTLDEGNLSLCLEAFAANHYSIPEKNQAQASCGGSAIDVLVCTPGRLVDHMDNTPGFTLQHLRFLVIDEADRLLSQSYHGWIARVLDQTESKHSASAESTLSMAPDGLSYNINPVTYRAQSSSSRTGTTVQLRKLLYSATLTRDPQKLASLRLVNPKHFNSHHLMSSNTAEHKAGGTLYSMPPKLKEYTIECTAEQKPLVLLALLLERLQQQQQRKGDDDKFSDESDDEDDNVPTNKSIIVVFTSSLESTHRLARLLQLLWLASGHGEPPVEFSSSLNQQQRSSLMKRCNDPHDPVSIIICSDGMSRGMDIEYVSTVINYDVPGFAKTYVHRCGRTARAGKEGEAISLLKGSGQVGLFGKLRRLIDFPEKVDNSMRIKTSLIRSSLPVYKGCMAGLKSLIHAEDKGELNRMDGDIEEFLP